jgi:hypothetical protein
MDAIWRVEPSEDQFDFLSRRSSPKSYVVYVRTYNIPFTGNFIEAMHGAKQDFSLRA